MSLCTYQVSLSSGEDTGINFSDHLYTALVSAGIHTCRAHDVIQRGQDTELKCQRAAEESRISVIVFSKGYASSGRCLDELLKILQRWKAVGHKVLPVYYNVDPSEVGNQIGSFGEAFANHEEQFMAATSERKKDLMEKVETWREALRAVAKLRGMVLQNQSDGHESKFIQEIIKEISNRLNRRVLSVTQYQIGIDSRVESINIWLQDGATDVGIGVISGIGGIGKTTIAKTVYNLNLERFERSSFLLDIRETSKQPNGLVRLQEQLLSDIRRGRKQKIGSVDEGIIKIKNAISCKRVLVVLDDVDQWEQLSAVLGMRDWFYPGSKVIITSRCEQLLKSFKVDITFKVKELDDNESLQLFSWHAFGQVHPIEGFIEYSRSVLQKCKGLPLALKMLGSSLRDSSVEEWETALEKMEAFTHNPILQTLAMSFTSLQDDHDKKLFLYIASFFVGTDKEYAVKILDECNFYTMVGIENLVDRGLIAIGKGNKLIMHQMLQDMARNIIRQESPNEPGERSILSDHEDSFHVLSNKTGTERVQGLILNMHMLMKDASSMTTSSDSHAKRQHDLQDTPDRWQDSSWKRRRLGLFSWKPITAALEKLFTVAKEVNLETDAFSMMHKLRLLQLNYVQLSGSYKRFPRKLRWLCWCGFPLKSMPCNFPLESLVSLDLRHSILEQVWKGTKFLRSLRFLNLSHCCSLTKTPDFSGLPSLERLLLKHCTSLVKVHDSIVDLEKLVLLNLKGCKNLRKLPRKIGQLKSLEKLILSGCSKLEMMPTELEKSKPLTVPHAYRTAVVQLLFTTGKTDLWRKNIRSWPSTPSKNMGLSLSILPFSLQKLSLRNCNLSDDTIPRDLSGLSMLLELDLSQNPISSLPESIKEGLAMLKSLWLDTCTRLQSLPELPSSLKELVARDCISLEKMKISSYLLKSLDVMQLSGCDKLVKVDGLFHLEAIESFHPEIINNLGFLDLESKRDIEVELCNNLTSTRTKGPLQGLHEFGILSIFLPRSKIPACFSNKSLGSSLSVIVPSFPNAKIRGFNICVVYACSDSHKDGSLHDFHVNISNITKGLEWTYRPTFHGNEEMIWLSHWNIRNQLQAGDALNVSMVVGVGFKVKECGTHFVYEQEKCTQPNGEKEVIKNDCVTCHQCGIDGDLSAYERSQGVYLLCHYCQHSHLYPPQNHSSTAGISQVSTSVQVGVRE